MAKNYEQIIAAVAAGNRMDFGNAIERGNGVPLDKSSVYASFHDAVYYALSNPVAYEGQVIAVTEPVGEDDALKDTKVYVITPASQGKYKFNNDENRTPMAEGAEGVDIYIKPVGTVTLGDDITIVKNDDDTLSIKGYTAAATGAQLTKTASGMEWVVPDTTAVSTLQGRMTAAEGDIGDLQGRMTAAEGDIGDLQGSVGDLQGSVGDLQGSVGVPTDPVDGDSLYARVAKNKSDIAKLNGTSTEEGSVAYQIAQIVAGADESYDTLKEVADWIATHGSDAATMSTNINNNANAIDALEALVGDTAVNTQITTALNGALKVTQPGGGTADKYALADHSHSQYLTQHQDISGKADKSDTYTKNEVDTKLSGKVDKVSGKSLVLDTEITKLAGVEAGAEKNIIEAVKVNGTALSVGTDRSVNIATGTLAFKNNVGTNDIVDDAVTNNKLAGNISPGKVVFTKADTLEQHIETMTLGQALDPYIRLVYDQSHENVLGIECNIAPKDMVDNLASRLTPSAIYNEHEEPESGRRIRGIDYVFEGNELVSNSSIDYTISGTSTTIYAADNVYTKTEVSNMLAWGNF